MTPATISVTTFADVVNPTDGLVSLREAISQANATPGADTIRLQAGLYQITLQPDAANPSATGSFDILGSATLLGAGAGKTVIDGGQLDRVFAVSGTSASRLGVLFQGLTVQGGNAAGDGGGILMGNADLTLRDCIVSGNRAAGSGGGISNAQARGTGNLTLIGTTVSANSAGDYGGGIYAGTATLSNSTVSANSAGRDGGGIYTNTSVTLAGSTVNGNSARHGGGIYTVSTARLTRSAVGATTPAETAGASTPTRRR